MMYATLCLEHIDACGSLDLVVQRFVHDFEFDLRAHRVTYCLEDDHLKLEALNIDVSLDRIVKLDLPVAIGGHTWFARPHHGACSSADCDSSMNVFLASPQFQVDNTSNDFHHVVPAYTPSLYVCKWFQCGSEAE